MIDKSKWGEGPWQHEPDKKEWQDAATGLPCAINRGRSGGLCGYVGVSPGHRYYNIHYREINDIDVHEGLTFSGMHGETKLWWLGFDCAHCMDYAPGLNSYLKISERGTYRTIDYVTEQIEYLAKQLKEK